MREITLAHLLRETKLKLEKEHIQEASLIARLLVEWVTNTTRKDAVLTPEKQVDKAACQRLEFAVERCKQGESVHRIIGFREFYGLKFLLSPAVLEPRPDTETLIDLILPFLQKKAEENEIITCLDIGTGSGAIAISLLSKIDRLHATAVDISQQALDIARKNAKISAVGKRFTPLRSNLFNKVDGVYDVIVSNPPYICQADIEKLDKNVRDFDPILALNGGEDGLDFYRQLSKKSAFYLKEEGVIGVEIGQHQEGDVEMLFKKAGFQLIEKKCDLSGIIRALLFKKHNKKIK